MKTQPHIIFAGAGPGDPDLITIKLVECLKTSSCILVDRLVNPIIISRYARPEAEVIFVGKQAYQQESTFQKDINELLISKAMCGKKTLRLKGGDVAIYSNVIDEIQAITAHNITYEIIPGITAASGAAASLGIALTGRGIAPGVQIHSMSTMHDIHDSDYLQWACTKDTLVFYMSVSALKKLVKGMIIHGAPEDSPLAIIEEATTRSQRTSIFTLNSFMNDTVEHDYRSPSLVIIGEMIHEIQKDFLRSNQAIATFEPLNSKTKIQTIHVV